MANSRAKKFAKALFEMYKADASVFDEKSNALNVFSEIWKTEKEISNFFNNLSVAQEKKQEIIKILASSIANNDKYFENFCQLLLENQALSEIVNISIEFKALLDAYKKILSLEITSASTISEAERNQIINFLKADINNLVTINWQEDSNLIGGFTVKAGDKMIDSSVKGALEKLKQNLF